MNKSPTKVDRRLKNPPRTAWGKGVSGNPNGRPPRWLSKKDWMDKHIPEKKKIELLDVAIEKALMGKSVDLLQFFLSRCLPPAALEDTIDIRFNNKDHAQRGEEIFSALEDKRITPSQAHMLFATLCNNVKLVEMTEIVARIKALEEAQAIK